MGSNSRAAIRRPAKGDDQRVDIGHGNLDQQVGNSPDHAERDEQQPTPTRHCRPFVHLTDRARPTRRRDDLPSVSLPPRPDPAAPRPPAAAGRCNGINAQVPGQHPHPADRIGETSWPASSSRTVESSGPVRWPPYRNWRYLFGGDVSWQTSRMSDGRAVLKMPESMTNAGKSACPLLARRRQLVIEGCLGPL